jgi:RHS repeat-associated protein
MVATLARSGNNSYTVGNQRSFDAWGSVRQGAAGGDPTGRYCGNLGHKQDDESGLIYMRARYYEPTSGRFVSEDPARDGGNWFAYCGNNPVGFADSSGKELFSPQSYLGAFIMGLGAALIGKGALAAYKSLQEVFMAMRSASWKAAFLGSSCGFGLQPYGMMFGYAIGAFEALEAAQKAQSAVASLSIGITLMYVGMFLLFSDDEISVSDIQMGDDARKELGKYGIK